MKKTRMTNQRLKILQYLRSVKTHPTAETVYEAVKKDLPNITLATVYRNLHHLTEQGEILQFEVKNVCHFDGDTRFHQHCVCNKCGKICDLFEEKVTKDTIKKLHVKGFEPKSMNIIIYGNCKKCK